VRLQAGEWLIREGELPYFFVLLEGSMELTKEVFGRRSISPTTRGEFFGEVPLILMGAPAFVSVMAKAPSRVARFDAQQTVRADPKLREVRCADPADHDEPRGQRAAVRQGDAQSRAS
jgi:CRP-like cAMP-binding protein